MYEVNRRYVEYIRGIEEYIGEEKGGGGSRKMGDR